MIKLFVSLGIFIIYRHGGRGGFEDLGETWFSGGTGGGISRRKPSTKRGL